MNFRKLTGVISAVSAVTVSAVCSAVNAFAEGEAATTTAAQSTPNMFTTLVIPMIIMFALLYFMAIRPQKKREQELKDMQSSLQIGDEVITSGGIVGIIVNIGDDTVVIETGGAKNKLRIKTWAIGENITASERIKDAKASAKKNSSVSSAAVVDDEAEEKKEKKNKK